MGGGGFCPACRLTRAAWADQAGETFSSERVPGCARGVRTGRDEGGRMTSVERVVIAPDSFKGTAGATEVARALAAGWAAVRPGDDLVLMPMADGGEGTLDAFELAVFGARRMPVT